MDRLIYGLGFVLGIGFGLVRWGWRYLHTLDGSMLTAALLCLAAGAALAYFAPRQTKGEGPWTL